MTTLADLVQFYLIKEAFTDENGKLRITCGDKPIRGPIGSNSFLRRLFSASGYRKIPEFGRINGYQYDASVHLVGRYQTTGPLSAVVIHQDDSETTVRISHKTKVEEELDFSKPVHLFCSFDRKRTVKMIVSDELYRAVSFCSAGGEVEDLIEQFLLLDKAQMAIKHILCDWETRRSILFFLAFAASRSADGIDLSDEDAIEAAIEAFNTNVRHSHQRESIVVFDIFSLIDEIDIGNLFLPLSTYRRWADDSFGRFLTVFGIVNGISPWSENSNLSIAKVLSDKLPSRYVESVSEYLPFLTERDSYLVLIMDMLSNKRTDPYRLGNSEDFLFHGLCVSQFDQSFTQRALDVLFEDSLAETHMRKILKLLAGPNGRFSEEYLFKICRKRLEERGEAAYHLVCAAILNAKSMETLEELVESAMLYFDDFDCLINSTRLSLYSWSALDSKDPRCCEAVASPLFLDFLLQQLKTYKRSLYSVCASTMHDLILSGLVSNQTIDDEQVFKTAICALKEDDSRLWAERLLSVFPLNNACQIPDEVAELCCQYADRFQTGLDKAEGEPEVSYGILSVLHYFEKHRFDQISSFQKLLNYYQKNDADASQMARMRLLQEQLSKVTPIKDNVLGRNTE